MDLTSMDLSWASALVSVRACVASIVDFWRHNDESDGAVFEWESTQNVVSAAPLSAKFLLVYFSYERTYYRLPRLTDAIR